MLASAEMRSATNGRADPDVDWALWLRAANSGDEAAYRRFLEAVSRHLRALSRRRLAALGCEVSAAEDIVQDALLAIHLKRHSWRSEEPVRPWVSAIARHKLIDHLKRRGRHIHVPIEDVLEFLPAEPSAEPTRTGDAARLLGHPPEKQRDVFRAIALGGASIREAAAQLAMSEVAVRVTLHRGLRRLAKLRQQE